MIIAPEHLLRERLTASEQKAYIKKARNKSDLERTEMAVWKTAISES